MTVRDRFEGFGEKTRAALRAGAVFVGIVLLAGIVLTHGLIATSNGFGALMILGAWVLSINFATWRAKRTYQNAMGGEDE